MAYLNWTGLPVRPEVSQLSPLKTRLTLKLRAEDFQSLISHLEEVYINQGTELRLGLPSGWVLFWKQRESGSRTILAHPEAEQWVGTIALERGHGETVLLSLKNLEVGQSLKMGECVALASVSNLEINFVRLES